MTAVVHRRFNRRTGVFVPPRLEGRFVVASLSDGERITDLADGLLGRECEEWPTGAGCEVYLDLAHEDGKWLVEWVVETAPDEDAATEAK